MAMGVKVNACDCFVDLRNPPRSQSEIESESEVRGRLFSLTSKSSNELPEAKGVQSVFQDVDVDWYIEHDSKQQQAPKKSTFASVASLFE